MHISILITISHREQMLLQYDSHRASFWNAAWCDGTFTALHEHKRLIVLKELTKMLKTGVIKESHRVRCSPIVLVVKKDSVSTTTR